MHAITAVQRIPTSVHFPCFWNTSVAPICACTWNLWRFLGDGVCGQSVNNVPLKLTCASVCLQPLFDVPWAGWKIFVSFPRCSFCHNLDREWNKLRHESDLSGSLLNWGYLWPFLTLKSFNSQLQICWLFLEWCLNNVQFLIFSISTIL